MDTSVRRKSLLKSLKCELDVILLDQMKRALRDLDKSGVIDEKQGDSSRVSLAKLNARGIVEHIGSKRP